MNHYDRSERERDRYDFPRVDPRVDPRSEIIDSLDSKFNMYERQIDQLFDFNYKSQDDIKQLFQMKDGILKTIDSLERNLSDSKQLNDLKICIRNYYELELHNKTRMEWIESYQFQLFIVQLFIICYLIYISTVSTLSVSHVSPV